MDIVHARAHFVFLTFFHILSLIIPITLLIHTHRCNMSMPVLIEPLRLAHDITHQVSSWRLGHHEVLGPSSHVLNQVFALFQRWLQSRSSRNLQVKAEAIHLGEWVQVDPVESEQVVAGELAQGGHD